VRTLQDSRQAFATLELTVHKRLAGVLNGDHTGLGLGPGSDTEEVVPYRSGEDDVRRIDWNVTARSAEPHVWRTRAEHELETWVLVDETASMDFGTVDVEKGELAAWVTGAIGLLSDGPGNRMGVAHLRSDGLDWSPALPARQAAFRALRGHRDSARAHAAHGETPSLARALLVLDQRLRRPGVRVVVSDFVEPDGTVERPFAWERALQRLGVRHDVVVVEVVDPRELELPDVGPVVLTDPETGRRSEVWTSSPRLREEYAALAAGHRAAVAAALRAAGVGHVVLRTDRDWVADLARFVSLRSGAGTRRRRNPR
jgi:uncharacterized protein (DUF58 family)